MYNKLTLNVIVTFISIALIPSVIYSQPVQPTLYVDDDAPNDPGPNDPLVSDPDENGSIDHPFDEIQEAIDKAEVLLKFPLRYRILVLPGTYNENISLTPDSQGKPNLVTLKSQRGPSCTTINGNQSGSVIEIKDNGSGSIIEGFTIINGYSQNGGGIFCEDTSPIIKNNIIENNSAVDGGGIQCRNSDPQIMCKPTIENNTIAMNISSNRGAGICCWHLEHTTTVIKNNHIYDNTSSTSGGGIFIRGGPQSTIDTIFIQENIISSNSSTNDGGGIYIEETGFYKIENNTIIYNSSNSGNGGGICQIGGLGLWYKYDVRILKNTIGENIASNGGGIFIAGKGTSIISDNNIYNNMAQYGSGGGISCTNKPSEDFGCDIIDQNNIYENSAVNGAGIYSTNYQIRIRSNMVYKNTASQNGGGLYADNLNDYGYTNNNTFYDNFADKGGGLYVPATGDIDPFYCIFWENIANTGNELFLETGGMIWPIDCDVKGGWIYGTFFDQDPEFKDKANYNLKIKDTSPCLNYVQNIIVEISNYDFEGEDRVMELKLDIGADERAPDE